MAKYLISELHQFRALPIVPLRLSNLANLFIWNTVQKHFLNHFPIHTHEHEKNACPKSKAARLRKISLSGPVTCRKSLKLFHPLAITESR